MSARVGSTTLGKTREMDGLKFHRLILGRCGTAGYIDSEQKRRYSCLMSPQRMHLSLGANFRVNTLAITTCIELVYLVRLRFPQGPASYVIYGAPYIPIGLSKRRFPASTYYISGSLLNYLSQSTSDRVFSPTFESSR